MRFGVYCEYCEMLVRVPSLSRAIQEVAKQEAQFKRLSQWVPIPDSAEIVTWIPLHRREEVIQ